MDSHEIIANNRAIHRRFPIPANLRRHLCTVAGIGAYVADNWIGPAINKTDLVAYLLLHDLGNLVKMNISRAELLDPEDRTRSEYWQQQQEEARKTYGKDDYQATLIMLSTLHVTPRVHQLIVDSDWHEMPRVAAGNDWEQKVGKYADYRAGPNGVISLDARIADLHIRYKGRLTPEEESNLATFEQAIHSIEKQIEKRIRVNKESITDEMILPYRRAF